jgi:hypothetical protein
VIPPLNGSVIVIETVLPPLEKKPFDPWCRQAWRLRIPERCREDEPARTGNPGSLDIALQQHERGIHAV